MDAGMTRASRAGDEESRTTLRNILYFVVAPLLGVVVAVGLFVLLRNWSRSPVYKIFTWQYVKPTYSFLTVTLTIYLSVCLSVCPSIHPSLSLPWA